MRSKLKASAKEGKYNPANGLNTLPDYRKERTIEIRKRAKSIETLIKNKGVK